MKKIFLFMATLILGVCIFPTFASASCQDIRFSDGNHFCFDIKKVNSTTFEAQVSSKSVSTSLSCVLTLPNDRSVTLSNCEGRFTYDGNDYGKINLKAAARTTYYFVANYDFRNGSFDGSYSSSSNYYSYSSSYSDYYPEFTSVTDSRPGLDRWIDVTLKVKRSGSSYNYNGRVDFYVERYSGGSWSRASSYQYDLDRSSYSFSSSDYGEVRLYNFIRFREEGEYRLVAELRDNNAATHQSFYVGNYYDSSSYSSSSSYNAKELFIYSISSSNPSVNQRIDVTLRAIANNGSIAKNYNKRVRIEVQEYRNGSWYSASSSDYDLDRTTYTFSTSDDGEKTFNSLVRFRYSGEYRLKFTEENDSSIYAVRTIKVGSSSSSSSSYSSSYNARELSVYSVSSSNPSTNKWINVTIKAIASNGSIASNYNKKIRIEVQEYRNGSWYSANSSDYDLDRTTYTFSTSDNGTKTFNSLVRFRYSGEYRLKFSEYNDSSVYGTRTINVGYGSSSSSSYSSSSSARELSVYSVSSSNPSTSQWVDVTVRALTSNGSIARNYNRKVKIEVQEYRNGSWYSANSSDYDLARTTYTFSTSDNGSKTFYSLVKFRYSGEYRLKFSEYNDSSVYGTRTFNVGSRSSYYYDYYDSYYYDSYYYDSYYDRYDNSYYSNDNFTDSELRKIRAIYDIWDQVISSLERDYPRLKNSSSWKNESNNFYRNMKDVLTDKRSASFRSWNDFYRGFTYWLSLTTRTR